MFHAWLVKIAKMAASSAPATRPGVSERKKTTVMEIKPSTGTDCRMSNNGTSTVSARRLLAASVAYVNVKMSDATIAISIRSAVRAA